MNFVMDGAFKVGFEINKQRKYRFLFKKNSHFGGFECLFNQPCMFLFVCAKDIDGYAIHQHKWREIENNHPQMYSELKSNILQHYETEYREPIFGFKSKEFEELKQKPGGMAFDSCIAIKDSGETVIARMKDMFRGSGNDENQIYKVENTIDEL